MKRGNVLIRGDLSTLPDAEKERLGFVFPYFFSVIFFDDRNLSV